MKKTYTPDMFLDPIAFSLQHQNIVMFHDFWHDKVGQQDRVSHCISWDCWFAGVSGPWWSCWSDTAGEQLVFITEYITSGSLLQFLNKTKKTKKVNAVSDKVHQITHYSIIDVDRYRSSYAMPHLWEGAVISSYFASVLWCMCSGHWGKKRPIHIQSVVCLDRHCWLFVLAVCLRLLVMWLVVL